NRKQRPAFYPTMPHSKILRKAGFVGGLQKLVRSPQIVPVILREVHISAAAHIIVHDNQEQWSSIRGGESVRIIPEPVDQTGGLRNLMRNLSIRALKLNQERQCLSRSRKIPRAIQRERRPKRI